MRFCLLYLLDQGQKLRFLLSNKNSLFKERLSDKLTTFATGSYLILTFDRNIFLSFLWPLLHVASRGWVLLRFDLNALPHLVEWKLFWDFWLFFLTIDCVYVRPCVSRILAWWLWLFNISSCCWVFVSAWFCCLIGWLLLKATVYVLLVLY